MAALGPLQITAFTTFFGIRMSQNYTKIGIYSHELVVKFGDFVDLELDDVCQQHWYIGCPAKCILKSTRLFFGSGEDTTCTAVV